jgi:hypothetical protein
MSKLYVTTGGAQHVLPQDGVEVVEFSDDEIAAARILAPMDNADRAALIQWAVAHPATAASEPAKPGNGKRRGRKPTVLDNQPAAEGNKPPLVGEVA